MNDCSKNLATLAKSIADAAHAYLAAHRRWCSLRKSTKSPAAVAAYAAYARTAGAFNDAVNARVAYLRTGVMS